ncbi:FAD-dependent monooxygenase [Actinocrispum sp. NPDC049592]|uniref:FAD-dependent monooxygenase n=1 Tax=Actinocrispum sp. NPDC049592 TaxID=3154835 RepID=UPI0034164B26
MSRVIVVGNGPVGQTCALLLARWGVPVLLLDRRPHREPVGSKAICQQRDVLDIWDSVGAGRQIAEEGVTWRTNRTFHRDAELFAVTLPETPGAAFPPFVNISQSRTEQILDERIAAQPLIDVRWGHEVTGISESGTVSCAQGTFEADYVVLCSGGHSEALRRSLGISFGGQVFDDRFLICDIRTDLPGWASERRFYFDPSWNPGRQVLIHPCPGSTFRIDWQVPGDYDLAAEEAGGHLDRRIRAIIGDKDYTIEWKSVYRFSSQVASRMRAGRVLLAGDAAHLYAPFGARGLNSGVADAENAAWKIAFVLNGWAGEALPESYNDERHAAALENLDVTSATMRFLVPQDATQAEYRRAVLDEARIPEVDSGRLAEPFWYARSPLTTPDPSRPLSARPPRGELPVPAPGTLVPDVVTPLGRLRALARDGFLLLTSENSPVFEPCPPPVRVVPMTRDLAAALAARPGEAWLIRPDAHVAAVLPTPARGDLDVAVRRACGYSRPRTIVGSK